MKFWLIIAIVITNVIVYKYNDGDALGERISANKEKLMNHNWNRPSLVMAKDKLTPEEAIYQISSFKIGEVNSLKSIEEALSTLRDEIENVSSRCPETKNLLSTRYKSAVNENTVSSAKVKQWVSFAYKRCNHRK